MGTVRAEITIKNSADVVKALEGLIKKKEELVGIHGDEAEIMLL